MIANRKFADELEEETDLVEEICEIAEAYAPDYDENKILEQMQTTVA